MSTGGITINGQRYERPDDMPPDVRRLYEEALRAIGPSLPGGPPSQTTRVVSSHPGLGLNASVVVTKTITVNGKTYRSREEMPPDVRRFVEDGLQQAARATGVGSTASGHHTTVRIDRPEIRAFLDSGRPSPLEPRPIEPRSMDPAAKQFLFNLVLWVLGALTFWFFLGR